MSTHTQLEPTLTLSCVSRNDVSHATRLVFDVHHRSRTSKKPKHRKHLVGSASLSLNEFLNKHPLPHPRPVEYDVRLSCPPPQRKSRTINGKQQHAAMLTVKFSVPHREARPYQSPPMTPISEHPGTDEMFSDGASCEYAEIAEKNCLMTVCDR